VIRRRSGWIGRGLVWLALPIVAAAVPMMSRAAPAEEPRRPGPAVRLTLDNDHFNFWQTPGERPDFGYTHGSELSVHVPRPSGRLPGWMSRLWLGDSAGGDAAIEVRLRQDIYSPWKLPPDRPYAGWLELSVGASRGSERGRRELLFTAGVTGQPSMAASVQRTMHRAFNQGTPPDWTDQIPFEPGFGLEAAALSRGIFLGRPDGPSLALGSLARGRVATYALDLRLGPALVAGWAPPGLWPRAVPRRRGPTLHVRLEPRVDFIGRDEYLDGPLFRDHPGPGAKPVVAESRAAVGVGWSSLGFEYAVLRRSREFEGQPKPHTYSSLSATWTH